MKQIKKLLTLKSALLLTGSIYYSSCSPTKTSQSSENNTLTADSTSTSKIVGGVLADADFQKQNGIVQLNMISNNGSISICTGSLIERDIVLTAAHCLADPNLKAVRVVFSTSMDNLTQAQVGYGIDARVDQNYSPSNDVHSLWNDVALLKLYKDAPADFQLAKLPQKDQVVDLKSGSRVTLAGFGITNAILRKTVTDAKGKTHVQELASTGAGTLRKVEGILVSDVRSDMKEMTLDQTDLRGACHGDSGGPAFLTQEDGSLLLVGVTSRGTEALGNCTESAVYTGVVGQLDWIQQNVASLHQPAATSATTTVAQK